MANERTRRCSAPRCYSEGVFRQTPVEKRRNHDTAWFAAIDTVRPARRVYFEKWLEQTYEDYPDFEEDLDQEDYVEDSDGNGELHDTGE